MYLHDYIENITANKIDLNNLDGPCKMQLNPIKMSDCEDHSNDSQNPTNAKKRSRVNQNETMLSSNVKNVWGQKDLSSLLQEKNDKIDKLERKIEEYKLENNNLQEDRKRYKKDVDLVSKIEKILLEKNLKINDLNCEIEQYKSKINTIEMQYRIDQETLEITKSANKKLIDLSTRQKHMPVTPSSIEVIAPSKEEKPIIKDNNAELQNIIDTYKGELDMYKSRVVNLEKIIGDYKMKTKNNQLLDNLMEKSSDMEAALIEELNNITKSYDNIMETNLYLETQLSSEKLRVSELIGENVLLKSKIKAFEDNRAFIESETRKLDAMKDDFQNKIKLLQTKIQGHDKVLAERDQKLMEYRMHMTNLQSNAKSMSNELCTIKNNCRILQDELLEMKNAKNQIDMDFADYKRLCEVYKNFLSDESPAIEKIERYRRILSCCLCDLNVKDVALSKCMHTFCESCVNDRFKARQRKCPTCQTEFSMNDVKKIYL